MDNVAILPSWFEEATEESAVQAFASDKSVYRSIVSLHVNQQYILDHAKRFNVLACGRRFGKTELSVELLSEKAQRGLPTAYFAPTYKMLSEVWRRCKYLLIDLLEHVSEQEKRLEIKGGGSIDFWSLDNPNTARGRKYARIIVDEAAMVRDAEAWPAVLRPLLTDYQGDAFFPSTPRGHNWFWLLWVMGNDPTQSDWQSFQYPTAANPTIPNLEAEIESAKALLPTRLFEQEYLAQFTDDGGGVFRGVDKVSTAIEQTEPVVGHEYVAGLDWAKENDFTVLSIWDKTTKTEAAIDRFNQVSWELQRGRVMNAWKKFGVKRIVAEKNSIGDPNIEALRRDGVPVDGFATTADSKGPLIESLALAVEKPECILLNDKVATAEMQAYELERLPSGRFRYGAPSGMHDDIVMARALGWHAVSHSRNILVQPIDIWGRG